MNYKIKNKPILVTGGAGFIGSQIVERLLSDGYETHVLDNLSQGNPQYIEKWKKSGNFKFLKIDLLDKKSLNQLDDYKLIYHCAADPEVRTSVTNPELHFSHNVNSTLNLLEVARKTLENFVFLSTSTVYGDAKQIPTPEDYSPMEPISPYGASKLACESLISSYAHSFDFKAINFRFANIIGETSTHGVIYDFIKKLKDNPKKLEILGDGTQNKSYLYISDCVDAIQHGLSHSSETVEAYNIGSEDTIDVKTIGKAVINEMGLADVQINYTGGVDGGRGWKGDVKNMQLSISKIKSLGWTPVYNSLEAVKLTVKNILSKNLIFTSENSQ